MRRQIFAALLALGVSGCVASGPLYTPADAPPSGRGTLYVYRMPSLVNAAGRAQFYLDGKPLLDLDSGGYSYCFISAGPHELTQGWNLDALDPLAPLLGRRVTYVNFNTVGGDILYVRFWNGIGNVDGQLSKIWGMTKRSPDDAKPEIFQRHYQPAKNCST